MSVVTIEIKKQGIVVGKWYVTQGNESEIVKYVTHVLNMAVYDRLFDTKVPGQS